jgi:pimeloyl-ACP methyl ester carboxylesterase
MPKLRVNGLDLSYIDDGVGTPVVFVHGAWMDLRYWEPQREAVAAHHRFVAYTLRYHGTPPWPDDGKNYSAATHAADLATFIHQLNAGPVHLVGLSMGGRLATMVALEHSDLLRSLTVLEPPLDDLLDDLPLRSSITRSPTGGVRPAGGVIRSRSGRSPEIRRASRVAIRERRLGRPYRLRSMARYRYWSENVSLPRLIGTE